MNSLHTHKQLVQEIGNEDTTSGFSVKSDLMVKKENFTFTSAHFRSDYIIICMVTAGSVIFSINFKEYDVPVNGFMITPPNAIKQLVKASDDATVSIVSFTSHFLDQLGISNVKVELFDYFSTKLSPYWQLDNVTASMMSKLILDLKIRNQGVKMHKFGKELLYTSLQTFLYEIGGLSDVYSQPVNIYVTRKEKLVMEFIQLVQKHFKKHRSVSGYAGMLNLTAKYLTETVKEISGKNASEMIADVVTLEAKYLLNDPAYNIGQIADLLYFIDQSSFGKFFKRQTNMSPKEYRNSL